MIENILYNFKEAQEILENFIHNERMIAKVYEASCTIVNAFKNGAKLMCCGNGGSFCDAMHLAEELTGKFRKDRPPLPAIAISDGAYLSCVANDYGYDEVFARFIKAHAKNNDVVIAISTSGKSPNIIKALETSKSLNLKTISLTGKSPNPSTQFSDIEISVINNDKVYFADRIQEMHIKIIHILIYLIEKQMFNL